MATEFDRPVVESATKFFTVADLSSLPTDLPSGTVDYEIDNGRLVTMVPPGDIHGSIQGNIVTELKIQGERKGYGKARSEFGSSIFLPLFPGSGRNMTGRNMVVFHQGAEITYNFDVPDPAACFPSDRRPALPRWTRQLFGDDFGGRVLSIQFQAPVQGFGYWPSTPGFEVKSYALTDDDLALLRHLPDLTYVSLSYTDVTDGGLQHLTETPEFKAAVFGQDNGNERRNFVSEGSAAIARPLSAD